MEKEVTNVSLRKDIKDRATKAVHEGKFTGISSLSALIEVALDELLKTVKED